MKDSSVEDPVSVDIGDVPGCSGQGYDKWGKYYLAKHPIHGTLKVYCFPERFDIERIAYDFGEDGGHGYLERTSRGSNETFISPDGNVFSKGWGKL